MVWEDGSASSLLPDPLCLVPFLCAYKIRNFSLKRLRLSMMKHRPHSKEKKTLSMPGLLEVVSEKIHCKNCCRKEHQDGRVTYHHQILGAVLAHPDCRQVIPLCPEPITKQDGATKNDCERNACHRFLTDLKREHPRLNLTICSDALSATAPHICTATNFCNTKLRLNNFSLEKISHSRRLPEI